MISTDTFHVSFDEARKKLMEMNLINNFLMNSAMEDPNDAKTIAQIILSTILNSTFEILEVTSEKGLTGIDSIYHGIRMDAHLKAQKSIKAAYADIYDLEIEDREADRPLIPKRTRYYSALSDSKCLPSGKSYDALPDYVSITILSYDPFLLNDMYYEARTHLATHPHYDYSDGRTNIFLYAGGNPNFTDSNYGKKVQELLKYIVSGKKPDTSNPDIEKLESIVSRIKTKSEVTKKLMKQWDRELSIKREATLEESERSAINWIKFCRSQNISDDMIRNNIMENYNFDEEKIDSLFKASLDL